MKQLNPHDLNWCVRRLPKKLFALATTQGFIIAGGFIRSCIANEPINDIDLFVPNIETGIELANMLVPDQDRAKNEKGLLPGVIATDNAFTIPAFKPAVQIIHRWTYKTPEDCIQSFDFTIAQAAIWVQDDKWQSLCHDSFYEDLAAKRLVYCAPDRNEDAGGSLLRVLKFLKGGWRQSTLVIIFLI